MERECIKEAPTVAEAVDAALEELGVQQDAVAYEILEEPGKKIFGIGSERAARVRVWIKEDYLEEQRTAARSDDACRATMTTRSQASRGALPAELRADEHRGALRRGP